MSNDQKENKKTEKSLDLTNVISTAIQIPGVKVSREAFLREQFKDFPQERIEFIVEKGPIEAGCTREELKRKANRIIKERTAISTGASVVAGLPGGVALAATMTLDVAQFYGIALRMAQELVYLYGEADIWCDGVPDPERVTNQLILYCGVMLGVSGASQTVRVMSSALATQALKKLPKMALTKKLYFQVITSIMKVFGVKVTKKMFANAVYKALPVVGGVVAGGITLASMLPMGNRLSNTLDKAHFDYTMTDFELDMRDISKVCAKETEGNNIQNREEAGNDTVANDIKQEDMFEKIQKAKQLLDSGIITEEEFAEIKAKLISQI